MLSFYYYQQYNQFVALFDSYSPSEIQGTEV